MEYKSNKVRSLNIQNEILLNNRLEEDFQKQLKPFTLLQTIILCPKYQIRDNYITPNNLIANIVSVMGTCMYVLTFVIRLLSSEACSPKYRLMFPEHYWKTVLVSQYLNLVLYGSGFVVNWFTNYRNSIDNVEILLNIQNVAKNIKSKPQLLACVKRNNIFIAIVGFVYVTYFSILHFAVFPYFSFHGFLNDMFLIYFNINLMYTVRVILLINCNLLRWINEAKCLGTNLNYTEHVVDKMSSTYIDILDSYKTFVKVSEDSALFFIMDGFLHTLLSIEVWVHMLKVKIADGSVVSPTITSLYLCCGWIINKFFVIAVLAYHMEKFYINVENVQAIAAKAIGTGGFAVGQRRMYKNIYRLSQCYFSRARARGLILLDACLLLELCRGITTYTVVILQWAFE